MGLPKLRSIFGAFLVPTWLHFASQNPPKTLPKPTPRGTKILIDFCIAFLSFMAPFWPPRGQLGALDGLKIEKMGSKNSDVAHPERFEMRPCFSTPSWAVLAPFWPPTWRHFGPSWLRFGPSWLRFGFETPLLIANLRAPGDGFPKLSSILVRFWCQLGSILPPKIHQKRSQKRPQEAPKF